MHYVKFMFAKLFLLLTFRTSVQYREGEKSERVLLSVLLISELKINSIVIA